VFAEKNRERDNAEQAETDISRDCVDHIEDVVVFILAAPNTTRNIFAR
jgi:hypothetical protein